MTKFEAGVRYEMRKLLKHILFYIVGVVAFVGAIQVISLPLTGFAGFGSVGFDGSYAFAFLFIVFWTAIAFGKDAGLFLQSGLARRELFAIFALAVVVEAFAFAFLDAAMSLAVPGFWVEQSLFLRMAGSYTAALFVQVFLLNLAVASCSLVLSALQRRVGTGWTVALLIGLYVLATVVLPGFFLLVPGGIEAYGRFFAALAGLPFAPAIPVVLCLAFTWALLRRANADRFAAGR